jgi:hypothetical protein
VQTLYQIFAYRHKLYHLREERNMRPETFASLVSALLYEKRLGFADPKLEKRYQEIYGEDFGQSNGNMQSQNVSKVYSWQVQLL